MNTGVPMYQGTDVEALGSVLAFGLVEAESSTAAAVLRVSGKLAGSFWAGSASASHLRSAGVTDAGQCIQLFKCVPKIEFGTSAFRD